MDPGPTAAAATTAVLAGLSIEMTGKDLGGLERFNTVRAARDGEYAGRAGHVEQVEPPVSEVERA
jgi:hypothetical protein